jgi:hypothetical protein
MDFFNQRASSEIHSGQGINVRERVLLDINGIDVIYLASNPFANIGAF